MRAGEPGHVSQVVNEQEPGFDLVLSPSAVQVNSDFHGKDLPVEVVQSFG